jgi:ABC-2 type transport system permease protein
MTAATSTGGYGLGQVVRMEWIRLRSLRSTFWLCAMTAVGMVAIGVAVLAAYRSHSPRPGAAQMVNDGLAGVVLGQLLVGVLGVVTMTGEYSSGMIRATLAAVPDRKLVLAAKAVVLGIVALAVGEAVCLATFLASQAALAGSAIPTSTLGDPGVARTVVLSGVYLAQIGLIGLGLGAAVRHTGAAIGALFGFLFVPMFVFGLLGPAGFHVARLLPMFILVNSVGVVTPTTGCLSAWAGTAVMCGYTAAALALGGWLLARRDA